MSGENQGSDGAFETDKRSFLKYLGAGALTLGVGTASAAASGEDGRRVGTEGGDSPVVMEDGKLALNSSAESAENPLLDDRTLRRKMRQDDVYKVTTADLREAIAELNRLEERGIVRFEKAESDRPGNVVVELTDKADVPVSGGAESDRIGTTSSHCGNGGKNDYEFKAFSIPPKHNFYLNDSTTKEVQEIAIYGAGISAAVTAILGATGAGSVGAAVTGVLAAFLSASAGLMGVENEGDGVILRANITSPVPPYGYVEVDSQCNGDGGIPW